MVKKITKRTISGLLATAACFTAFAFNAPSFSSVKAESGRNIADGVYYIRNLNSNKYMDINWGRTDNGTEVIQFGYNGGGLNQQFKITRESDGYYSIKPMHCPTSAIDLVSSSKANTNGTDAQIYSYSNSYIEQKFTITNAVGGGFQIGTAASGGKKVLEVTDSSLESCATIQIWDYNNSRMNDNWAFERVSPGKMSYFTITTLSSGDLNDANAIVDSFSNIGYDAHQYTYPSTSTVKNNASDSSVIVFHGHGNTGFVRVHDKNNNTLYDLYSEKAPSGAQNLGTVIPSSTWKHTSLVYFATCNSAASNSTRKSMTQSAYDLGATCAIGFSGSVAGGEDFLRYMMDAVRSNPDITVRQAINSAVNEFVRTRGNSTLTNEASPANPNNRVVLGNQDITLKKR